MISKFTIRGFRGFVDEQTLVLAKPDSTNTGSGITYVVGENNVGKTSLVEALMVGDKKDGTQIYYPNKDDVKDDFRHILYEGNKTIRNMEPIKKGASAVKDVSTIDSKQYFTLIPSRRQWSPYANNNNANFENAYDNNVNSVKARQSIESHYYLQIADMLQGLYGNNDQKQYNDSVLLIKEVFPEFNQYDVVNQDDRLHIQYTTGDKVTHRADFLGDGVVSIIAIAAFLVSKKDTILIIDEPELSLHPLAQRRLAKMLANRSMNQQIIICTHSPYFIDWQYLTNGAKLNKITKHDEKKSEIHTLKPTSSYEKLINGDNWAQPFLMDPVAREIFFYDNVLFVEGQSDVGLLRNSGDLKDSINIFGYGVRGKDAFETAFRLSRDLGIQKAMALLDGDVTESVKQPLAVFTSYKVVQWSKLDIHDKSGYFPMKANGMPDESKKSLPKDGYFTEKGEKKDKSELKDYDKKINTINKYFFPPDRKRRAGPRKNINL